MTGRAALRAALACAAAAAVGAGCGPNPYEARIEGVLLADADAVHPVASAGAPLLTLQTGAPDPQPAGPGPARLAIARDVPWSRVDAVLRALLAAGVRPELLAGKRDAVRGFVLSDDPLDGPAIALTSTADGKFCVGPPTTNTAKCVQGSDRKHINRAFVREILRDAVAAYHLDDVDVVVAPELAWQDVVRTIDGARTCCGGTPIRVRLQGAPTAQ